MKSVELAPLPRWFAAVRLLLVVVVAGAGLATTAIFGPPHHVGYAVKDGVLGVDVQLGLLDLGRSVPVDRIRAMRVVDARRAQRTSGTAIHDLCHGQWSLASGDRVWMATTCTSPGLLLEVEGDERPWVLTPDDLDGFRAALEAGRDVEMAPLRGRAEPAFWSLLRFGMPLLLLVLVPIVARAGSGLSAGIEGAHLVVTTGWRTLHFPLEGATLRRGLARHGMWRIKAIRMGSVQLGRARGAAGPVQLLVTDPSRAVEVQPVVGLPVVVSVVDMEGFERACVAAGAVVGPAT
jgi:hypothetical protein